LLQATTIRSKDHWVGKEQTAFKQYEAFDALVTEAQVSRLLLQGQREADRAIIAKNCRTQSHHLTVFRMSF
jgi:hypothetical protein